VYQYGHDVPALHECGADVRAPHGGAAHGAALSPGDTAPIAVIDAVIDRRTERISSSGERRLAKRILCELHQTLFKGVAR